MLSNTSTGVWVSFRASLRYKVNNYLGPGHFYHPSPSYYSNANAGSNTQPPNYGSCVFRIIYTYLSGRIFPRQSSQQLPDGDGMISSVEEGRAIERSFSICSRTFIHIQVDADSLEFAYLARF